MDICTGCMSPGRRLKVLKDNMKLYQMLLGSRKKLQVLLCWECEARLRAIAKFQCRIKKAQASLSNSHSLSTLTTQIINKIHLIISEDAEIKTDETYSSEVKKELPSDDEKNDLDFFWDSDQRDWDLEESKANIPNRKCVKKEITVENVKKKVKRKSVTLKRRRRKVKIQPQEYTKYVYEIPLMSEDGKTETNAMEENAVSDKSNFRLMCRLCRTETDPDQVLAHFRREHKFVVVCELCGHTVGTLEEGAQHDAALHARLTCDHCGRRTRTARTMARHILNHHTPAECDHCARVFPSRRRLRRHASLAHAPPEEAGYCAPCDRHFPTRRAYRSHLEGARAHRDRPKIPCPDCGKVFAKRYNLRNHRLTVHAPVAAYRCQECGKVLSSKDSLRRHTDGVHRGLKQPRSKMCPFCGRTFQTNRILTHHVRTHTGERPHACALCPAAFAQKHALTVHARNVHARRAAPDT